VESDEVLERLYDHCTDPRFVLTYKWRAGNLILWDNCCTMHHATTDVLPADRYRTLYRINTKGSRPV
jgi:taurine dioxygenase